MAYLLPRSGGTARKTVTFTGAAGAGAVGTVAVFTVSGRVMVTVIGAYCTTLLTEAGATSTIKLGTATDDDRYIANPTGGVTDIDAGEWWGGTTPVAGSIDILSASGSGAATPDQSGILTSESIILTIGAQACNAGVLDVYCIWEPLSAGATLVAA